MQTKILCFALPLLIFLTLPLTAMAQVVDIPDPNLRAAIEDALGKTSGDTITVAEMAKLTHLEARNANISDLTGLEHATNLKTLALGYGEVGNSNAVKDLSPLAGLIQLTKLDLSGNSISDISAVTGLTNLTWLHFWGNSISDISPVAGLTKLTDLYLGNNNITDISPVAGLTSLTGLWLNGNNITDISALAGLTNLTELWLGTNNITDISPVVGLTNLTRLELRNNNITAISALVDLTNLTRLGLRHNHISDLSPLIANTGLGSGDEVLLNDNPLSYSSIKTHVPALQNRGITVEFDNVSVKVVEPVNIPDPNLRAAIVTTLNKAPGATLTTWDMATLTRLEARNANISDLTGLQHATNLTWLNLGFNNISDISPLVANTGLGSGDRVFINGNPLLNIESIKTHIPALQSRGVTVIDDITHLNIGESRKMRLIYFLPNDRPYRPEVVQHMKDEIRTVQSFFAEMMEAHGYRYKTFDIETDGQGEPKVHRVDGQYPSLYYHTEGMVRSEIAQTFHYYSNIYFIAVDIDVLRRNDRPGDTGEDFGGAGARHGKNGGYALTGANFDTILVAHELGHAFGLEWHDFRDGSYLLSYGPGQDQLSVCHADYLAIHPYFNINTSIEIISLPSIELISPLSYPIGTKRVSIQLKISDAEGMYQVFLLVKTREPQEAAGQFEIRSCRSLFGTTEAIIDFDYDGTIPSDESRGLSDVQVHPMSVEVVDTDGNIGAIDFVLFSESLESLTKISGDDQHGLPNTPLLAPLVVELRELNEGFVREGVRVSFIVTAGGGTVSQARTETDWNGRAETTLTLGPELGENRVLVSAEGVTVTFTAVAGAPVAIPDKNLRAAVENALSKKPGQPIAPADMATLTLLDAPKANISDLNGLEHATNLTILSLWDNSISDISSVSGLTNLTRLALGGNAVSDISPLAGLTRLTDLHLPGNRIGDISIVAGLANLRYLYLGGTNISDISPLVANTGLGSGDTVNVQRNPLSYLSIHTHIPALQSRGVTVEYDADGTRPPDVNGDGSVDVLDLIVVTSYFGHTGENIATDVSGDGVVDVLDLVLVAGSFDRTAAAPSTQPQVPEALTAVEVQGWLTEARTLEGRDLIMQRGILVLEHLLVVLTPTETELLANYPNPFNPETWIPYRLTEGGFVTLTIYDGKGQVVRSLDVGHRIASAYESRSKAIYWDGRNATGEAVASGVYFYTLTAGEYSKTRKMLILK